MDERHTGFIFDFIGRIGAPLFAATLVGCLLAEQIKLTHIVLLATGILFIGISHWHAYHRKE